LVIFAKIYALVNFESVKRENLLSEIRNIFQARKNKAISKMRNLFFFYIIN